MILQKLHNDCTSAEFTVKIGASFCDFGERVGVFVFFTSE